MSQVNGNDAAVFQHTLPRRRQIKPANEIDTWRIVPEMVSDPSRPVKEVGIISRNTKSGEDVLHHRLLGKIHERSEAGRIGTEIFFCKDERAGGGERSVKLDDTGSD